MGGGGGGGGFSNVTVMEAVVRGSINTCPTGEPAGGMRLQV